MPEHFRALIIVLAIAAVVFFLARRGYGQVVGSKEASRWPLIWVSATCVGFTFGDFWIVLIVIAGLVAAAQSKEDFRPAIFLLLVCVLPISGKEIPGFGVVNFLFKINIPILLSIAILIPALISERKKTRHKITTPDRIIAAYLLLLVALMLRETTVTDTMRHAFVLIVTMLVPYLAFSRTVNEMRDVRRAMLAFVLPLFVLSALGVFEMLRHWHLYSSLPSHWGVGGHTSYGQRAGYLRAYASFAGSGPIVFGYAIMIALGFFLPHATNKLPRRQAIAGYATLAAGLLSSLSRGPWLGTATLLAVYIATGPSGFGRLARSGVLALVVFGALAVTPIGQKFIDLLPFVGEVDAQNVSYRQRLVENSWIVIERNLLLGSVNYLDTPEMQAMIQGQGIIDIVNTYIRVALETGLIGLGLFCAFFLTILIRLRRAIKALPAEEEYLKQTGRALFATLIGTLVTIGTVSSVGQVPILYWTVAGLCVAQTRIIQRRLSEIAAHKENTWRQAA